MKKLGSRFFIKQQMFYKEFKTYAYKEVISQRLELISKGNGWSVMQGFRLTENVARTLGNEENAFSQ